MEPKTPRTLPIQSATFTQEVNAEIRRAAETGIYDIRGGGAKRKVPHFDDLVFLGASVSRYPLEGYRETCNSKVTLGTRFAKKPIELDIPITIAGMSFGALSGQAKEAIGRGASAAGTSSGTLSLAKFAIALAAEIFISSFIVFALTSSAPLNIYGKPIKLLTWFA